MPGLFNVENALAAIATAMVLDIPFKNIYNGLKVARASGRMEAHVSKDGNIIVIVDYAHNKSIKLVNDSCKDSEFDFQFSKSSEISSISFGSLDFT